MHPVLDLLEIDFLGSYLTLGPGFDSEANWMTIRGQGLLPVIKPVRRNHQSETSFAERREEFEQHRDIYLKRVAIERSFAWEDVYRKLVMRYEKLQCTHLGFKHLAYSMVNLRWFIGKS